MPQPITQPCGTYAAARRHERRGEELCEPCIEARRAWWREHAQIAYSIPAWRARENARSAARQARRRRSDPTWRQQQNEARRLRRQRDLEDAKRYADPIAIERFLYGDDVPLTREERREAVRLLHSRGLSPTAIARQLHMSGATVNAHLRRVEGAEVAS